MLSRVNSYSNPDCTDTRYSEPIRACENGFRPDPFNESEVVDELLQILVECLKKADLRGQEILLRKFFYEIENERPLETFLVERLKQSKISSLFDQRFFRSETAAAEVSSRELNVRERETTSEKEKLERFKVKTLQVGDVVKEEKAG